MLTADAAASVSTMSLFINLNMCGFRLIVALVSLRWGSEIFPPSKGLMFESAERFGTGALSAPVVGWAAAVSGGICLNHDAKIGFSFRMAITKYNIFSLVVWDLCLFVRYFQTV